MKVVLLLSFVLMGCSTHVQSKSESTWARDNELKIQKYLESTSTLKSPVAIFDWDNTVIKNDVGDAVMLWMVKNGLILRPKSWKKTSRWLSEEAIRSLNQNCVDAPEKKPLPTSKNKKCADTILSIYLDGSGWLENYNKDTIEPGYAWLASLLHGYSPQEVRAIAAEAIRFNLENSPGFKEEIGTKSYSAYMRVYPQMKKLITELIESKVNVWVVSASPQPIVEVFGEYVGISAQKVIGIRNQVDRKGKYTHAFLACGTYKEGNQEIISYRQGKRCWINKEIFKLSDDKEQMNLPSPISFAAGDSDTDAFFLKDAKDFRIVINRNKPEIMCHALHNLDGKWIINPMFLDPKPRKESAYECKQYGLADIFE